ncbi:MAG TPA: hypothetical protein VID68_05745 [Solirubrobacteraceae bacterium]|jgi:uncharacterized membrane protein
MPWDLFVGLSLVGGVVFAPRWTVLVWPLAAVSAGATAVLTSQPRYDVHGFGYFVGVAVALLCVAAWLIGRLVRAAAGRRLYRWWWSRRKGLA